MRFLVISAVVMPDLGEEGIDESRALRYALLVSLFLAGITLLLRILLGSFLDLAFEITLCYLPVVLLLALYVWMKLRNR
jgi:hypothetical protein